MQDQSLIDFEQPLLLRNELQESTHCSGVSEQCR